MKNVVYVLMLGLLFGACQSEKRIRARRAAYVSSQQLDSKEETAPESAQADAIGSAGNKDGVKPPVREKVEKTSGAELKQYCIIVGSFVSEQNAVNLSKQLIRQGFRSTSIMRNEKGMFRVSASSYNDYERASLEVRGIRKAFEEYKDAWVLIPQR